jgi:hypothetical protein
MEQQKPSHIIEGPYYYCEKLSENREKFISNLDISGPSISYFKNIIIIKIALVSFNLKKKTYFLQIH